MRAAALLPVIAACSFALGTPRKLGWPSGDPDDYAYWQSYNCFVYEKTFAVDLVTTIIGAAIAAVAELGDNRPIAIVAGTITTPFAVSAVAGGLGRSRCHRWARELPLEPNAPIPATGSGDRGSGAPGEPDGPPR